MTPTFNDSALRVLARRQRELKRTPWLKPYVKPAPSPDSILEGLQMREAHKRRMTGRPHGGLITGGPVTVQQEKRVNDFMVWSFDQGTERDYVGIAAVMPAPTGRVDRITGTVEIGGRAQEWVLVNQNGCIEFHNCGNEIMAFDYDSHYLLMDTTCKDGIWDIKIPKLVDKLTPDPNFTPPGQYVEANGIKFWVRESMLGISLWMNGVRLFTVCGAQSKLAMSQRVAHVTKCNVVYPYTGCHCDTCGGGE